MRNSETKDSTTRFLIYSFIGLLIFSISVFSLLGIYMSRKSEKAVYEVGQIYMSGMNKQMSKHFETVINLRFNQVSGIVWRWHYDLPYAGWQHEHWTGSSTPTGVHHQFPFFRG